MQNVYWDEVFSTLSIPDEAPREITRGCAKIRAGWSEDAH